MYDFITIERSYACGGHEISTALSKKLNYRLFDHNVLVETCKRLDLPHNVVYDMDEKVPVKTPFKVPGHKYLSLEEQIFNTETEIIQEAVKEPGAIFVGRCASKIINDIENVRSLKVFITASHSFRKERALNVEKLDPAHVDNLMHKNDVRREKYFTAYAKAKWADPGYFDLILNSGELGIKACVDILATACKGNGN